MPRKTPHQIVILIVLCLILQPTRVVAQDQLREEDLQEILEAIEESDSPAQFSRISEEKELKSQDSTTQMWFDGRVSGLMNGVLDQQSRLKIQLRGLMARGRVRKAINGDRLAAGTAMLEWGALKIQAGGIGMNVGYGLLIQRPGRSAGLSAGQPFGGFSNRLVGWATSPDKKSIMGLGSNLRVKGWNLALIHGKPGDGNTETPWSGLNVSRDWRAGHFGIGALHRPGQSGVSISGTWSLPSTNLGFEWAHWGDPNSDVMHGAWLMAFKTNPMTGLKIQARWAASNSDDGPKTGGRPAVLGAWGGAGWAVRVDGRLTKCWRLKMLLSHSAGPQWRHTHRKQSKRFIDLLLSGRFPEGWDLKMRWNERMRLTEGWSEDFPWLPPKTIAEDERTGLALNLKRKLAWGSWSAMVRSLGRLGVTNDGRRTLAGVRCKGMISSAMSVLFSYQWAWGESVDLVSAVNPIPGVVLPRHWGHWSSEIMIGLENSTRIGKLVAAFSRRQPDGNHPGEEEILFWTGFQGRWK